jgi:hypothetical protein
MSNDIDTFLRFIGNNTTQQFALRMTKDDQLIRAACDRLEFISARYEEKGISRVFSTVETQPSLANRTFSHVRIPYGVPLHGDQ